VSHGAANDTDMRAAEADATQDFGDAADVPLACSIDDPDCEACQ
jgi:ribonucleoside-diphosphate reductase alpha chain